MTTCPTYVVPPGFQLQSGGSTGPYDCTAWAASRAIGHATCGNHVPSGRKIRLQSDEPVPDPRSPGLNLPQVANVASDHYGVHLEVHTGYQALTWTEYEAARGSGRGAIIQLSYAVIHGTPFDAGRGFTGGHAMFESRHSTYDPLADGRDSTYRWQLRLYPRDLMKRAAGDLIIGHDSKGHPVRVGYGKVWCALTTDVAPETVVTIRPRSGHTIRHFRSMNFAAGEIIGYTVRRTRGFSRKGSAPRAFRMKGRPGYHYRVKVLAGVHRGQWVARHWAR